MIKLYNGDCREVLSDLIDAGVKADIVITSPPYNMNLRISNGRYISRCSNRNHKLEFSTKYKNYLDDMPMDEYFEFQKDVIEKLLKISDLVFYNIQIITGNKVALFKLFGHFSEKIKEVIIWDKIRAEPAMSCGVLNSQYELIIVFQNSKPYARKFDLANFSRGCESNVWAIKRERNKYIKAGFPEALVEKILTLFTVEGAVVLDPFMGSGTSGIVSRRLNRRYIGIELDEEYFKVADERISGEERKVGIL